MTSEKNIRLPSSKATSFVKKMGQPTHHLAVRNSVSESIDSKLKIAHEALWRFLIGIILYNMSRNLTTIAIAVMGWENDTGKLILVVVKVFAALIPAAAIFRVPGRWTQVAYVSAVVLAVGIQLSRYLGLDSLAMRPFLRGLDTLVLLGLVYTTVGLLTHRAVAERTKEEDFLDALSLRTAGKVGDDFLVHLVNGIVRLLDLKHACLAEYQEETGAREIVAASSAGLSPIDMTALLNSRSRADIVGKKDPHFTAIPLSGEVSDGDDTQPKNLLGYIYLVHDSKFTMSTQQQAALRVFGGRAAAELERRRLDSINAALESRMRHVQKLESLGVMAGGIAHDFNNLLTAIRSNANLLIEDSDTSAASFQRVAGIQLAVDRGQRLCDSLLAYSGKSVTNKSLVNVNSLLQELATVVHASSPEKKFDLLLCDEPTFVWGDDGQISQVFLNLMKNAQEATEGTADIALKVVTKTGSQRSKSRATDSVESPRLLFVDVIDSGHGIEANELNRVFDPFFSTKGVGRGLGLAAVLGIVRKHGGDIQVESEFGVGTKFSVSLPLTSKRPQPSDKNQVSTRLLNNYNDNREVLLVDDDELVRDSLEVQLVQMGMRVTALSNGEQAIKNYQHRGDVFDVVIVDQTMSGLSGIDTIRRLRELGLKSKMVLTSGYSQQGIGELPADLGFLRKPYTKADLIEATCGLTKVADA